MVVEEGGDHFDRLPDCLLLDILDRVSDAKSLARCLSVSCRFRSIVPLATSLRLVVDRVIPISSDAPSRPFSSFVKSCAALLKLFLPLSFPLLPSPYSSPRSVLRGFRCVRDLHIQLPFPVAVRDERSGAFLRYRATFGETLEKCVVLVGFKRKEEEAGDDREARKGLGEEQEEEVKERVFWVIRALADACKRHNYAARELIGEHPGLARLRMSDAAGEGVVEMDEGGLEECRKHAPPVEGWCRVPRVKMQMWYGRKTEVRCQGEVFEGATLVVVRTVKDGTRDTADGDEAATTTAKDAFWDDQGFEKVVGELVKSRSYWL